MDKIEKSFGKGSIMRMGNDQVQEVEVIPTGSIALNAALGVGGYPKDVSLKFTVRNLLSETTLGNPCEWLTEAQKAESIAAFIDAATLRNDRMAANGADGPLICGFHSLTMVNRLSKLPNDADSAHRLSIITASTTLGAASTPKAETEGDTGDNRVGSSKPASGRSAGVSWTSTISKHRHHLYFHQPVA
ncbi:MAG: hypothetical protein ACLTOV_04925 [Phocaeicola sp.]